MDTDYDQIAGQYRRAKRQPWRTHIERYTLGRMTGDLNGRAVLDLACGEGYYTRELKRWGAERVVGVDQSRGMIELAADEEAREPLGLEYRVADARTLEMAEPFDLVFAAYLLNYARTVEELTQMGRAVSRALKPGGRFVTVNNNPAEPVSNFPTGRAYGYTKRLEGEPVDGTTVVWEFFLPQGSFEVRNYLLSSDAVDAAFEQAGLRAVGSIPPVVSPEGIREFGEGYWAAFLACPPVVFLEYERIGRADAV
jgi:SAM-dependent methyltransferase